MRSRLYSRVISLSVVAVLVIGSASFPTRATIQEEKDNITALEKQKQEVQGVIDGLKQDKAALEENVKTLDAELTVVSEALYKTTTELDDVEVKIEKNEKKLKKANKSIKKQYAAMKLRIQFMYENGNQQMIDLILSSDSIGDFLNKAEYISELTTYDRNMLEKYKKTKQTIEETKKTLEEQKDTLEKLKEEQETQKANVESLVAAKQQQIATYDSKIKSNEGKIVELEVEIGNSEQAIAEMESIEAQRQAEQESREQESREQASRQAEQQNNNTYNPPAQQEQPVYHGGGAFGWPLPGYYTQSSGYGYRSDPFTGETRYHSGIDLPAPSGTPIVAAGSGQVAWANYSATAGNWIGIDHGNGLYTVYMHMSALLVSPGQNVSQGQTIGLVGTTGSSTGNHLHFSVRLNGAYVNPNDYL
ncbi:MAG: peptidoglycan DD-metalloendopeptidase family protein [Lachnospiraceae bacterium]|nr:peptidoglycan DD-metalloendopeptidase family protein [Lachnospiraceae bacterium]